MLLVLFLLLIPAAADCADVTLSWAAPSDSRVVGYYVYWSPEASDFGDPADPGNRPSQRTRVEPADITSCTISDLEAGQTYYFAATSFDAEGNQSQFSEVIEYTVPWPAADVDDDGDGYTENQGDCNDNNASVHPGATEICGDGIDQDCSGADASCPENVDQDGDGYTEAEGDCNDSDSGIYPGAIEVCGDGIDQDCSGADLSCTDADADGDGYTINQGDCNDNNASVHPGAIEICGDGIDQDCSGSDLPCTDDDTTDSDGDGVADIVERNAPDNGDGNDDGTPDDGQCNVVSLQDPDAVHFITLASEPGTQIKNCRIVASLDEKMPANAEFEWGVLEFTITGIPKGGSVRLKIYLPEGAAPTGYQKYGPTRENPADHWHSFDYNGETGAEIDGNVITLHLKDGARGDKLLTADGRIIDPGGPVYATGASPDDSPEGSSESSDGSFGGCFIQTLNPFR